MTIKDFYENWKFNVINFSRKMKINKIFNEETRKIR